MNAVGYTYDSEITSANIALGHFERRRRNTEMIQPFSENNALFDGAMHGRFCLPLLDPASVFRSTKPPPLRHGTIRGGVTPIPAPMYLDAQIELIPHFHLSLSSM
jgi:hypothetical protein